MSSYIIRFGMHRKKIELHCTGFPVHGKRRSEIFFLKREQPGETGDSHWVEKSFLDQNSYFHVKFTYSQKATKFCKIFSLLLTGTTQGKSKVEILQNFVAFSEYMNFNMTNATLKWFCPNCGCTMLHLLVCSTYVVRNLCWDHTR